MTWLLQLKAPGLKSQAATSQLSAHNFELLAKATEGSNL